MAQHNFPATSPAVFPISANEIPDNEPLPFNLRDANGRILARRNQIFTKEAIKRISQRGGSFFVERDSENDAFGSPGTTTGQLRNTFTADWYDLTEQANGLLRSPHSLRFKSSLTKFHNTVHQYFLNYSDSALLALFYLSAKETHIYSATHSMLVSLMCTLAAKDVLRWSEEDTRIVSLAALTMNIGMTELQDKLAQQDVALSGEQRELVNGHAARSVQILKSAGIDDEAWLEAVELHHSAPHGALKNLPSQGQKMARLIQRADTFGARRAPRGSRSPSSLSAAMQASYFDESGAVDEAGTALLKAVGIHSPGSFVKLKTGEIAVVVRRGENTTKPKVLVVTSQEGILLSRFELRDTACHENQIAKAVNRSELKLNINLKRILRFA